MRITLYRCDGTPLFAFSRGDAMRTFRTLYGYQAHTVEPWTKSRTSEVSK